LGDIDEAVMLESGEEKSYNLQELVLSSSLLRSDKSNFFLTEYLIRRFIAKIFCRRKT